MKWILVVAALAACGKSDKPSAGTAAGSDRAVAGQTAREAMELMCNVETRSGAMGQTPDNRRRAMAGWLSDHVTNVEVDTMWHGLDAVSPDAGKAIVAEMAKKHGVVPCPYAATPPKLALDLPLFDAPMSGGDDYRPDTPLVVVTRTGITFEGAAVVALTGGLVDSADLSGGGVARLTKLVASLHPERVYVAIEQSVPYRTMHEVWTAIGAAGVEYVAFVGKRGEELRVVPVGLHSKNPPFGTDKVLTFTDDTVVRWTLSGTGGTRDKPAGSWKLADDGVMHKQLALEVGNGGVIANGGPPLVLQFPDSFTAGRAAGFAKQLDASYAPLLGRSAP